MGFFEFMDRERDSLRATLIRDGVRANDDNIASLARQIWASMTPAQKATFKVSRESSTTTPFMRFMKQNMDAIKAALKLRGGEQTIVARTSLAGEMWRSLTPSQKARY